MIYIPNKGPKNLNRQPHPRKKIIYVLVAKKGRAGYGLDPLCIFYKQKNQIIAVSCEAEAGERRVGDNT